MFIFFRLQPYDWQWLKSQQQPQNTLSASLCPWCHFVAQPVQLEHQVISGVLQVHQALLGLQQFSLFYPQLSLSDSFRDCKNVFSLAVAGWLCIRFSSMWVSQYSPTQPRTSSMSAIQVLISRDIQQGLLQMVETSSHPIQASWWWSSRGRRGLTRTAWSSRSRQGSCLQEVWREVCMCRQASRECGAEDGGQPELWVMWNKFVGAVILDDLCNDFESVILINKHIIVRNSFEVVLFPYWDWI